MTALQGGPRPEGGPAASEFTAAVLLVSVALLPMNVFRLPGNLTPADVGILGVLALSAVGLVREVRPPGGPLAVLLLGCGATAVASLLSVLIGYEADDAGTNVASAFAFAVSSIGALLAFTVLRPPSVTLRRLVGAFVAGMTFSAVVIHVVPTPRSDGRALALTDHPNTAGLLFCMAVPCAIYLARTTSPRKAVFHLGVALLLVDAALRTGSRSAPITISLILAGGFLHLVGRRLRIVGLLLVLFPFAAVLLLPVLLQANAVDRLLRLESEASAGSDSRRISLLTDAAEAIFERPIVGHGLSGARDAHNLVLGLWYGAGLVGLALTLYLLYLVFVRVRLLPVSPYAAAALARGLGLALGVGVLLQSNIWDRWLWFGFALVLIAGDERSERSPVIVTMSRRARPRRDPGTRAPTSTTAGGPRGRR